MSAELPHLVSQRPFEPQAVEVMTAGQERYYLASQWRLMWWKFRRHRLAVVAGAILILAYGSTLVTELLAPYALHTRNTDHIFAPPQLVRVLHEGRLHAPFVYPLVYKLDMETLKREYTEDRSQPQALRFLCLGDKYRFWGLVEGRFHLVCPPAGGTFFLLGTDRLGRDMLSRLLYGARISLTVGLIGIAISFLLGITIGGFAGYLGGWFDAVVQRLTEILRSLPVLPIWMALSAALPVTWSPVVVYFGITIILGLLDWPSLARAVRSKLLALREEDYALASRLMGAPPSYIIRRHLLPNFMSHLIASATLSIPGMILGETALSFLGLGLRPPITSWGVMLAEAQNIEAVALYPWLLWPMAPVVLIVLAFNFFGDGLRDAADPYH